MKYLIYFLSLLYIETLASQPPGIYRGGDGHGYDMSAISDSNVDYFLGGNASGYTSDVNSQLNTVLFLGGQSSGYDSKAATKTNGDYFLGGNNCGYSSFFHRTPFIWTGAVGTSWTVSGNWNYNLIPGIYRPVIIPDGVPNWPFINAGLFNIGDNPNNGLYKCASLWIQDGALLVTRINNRIENYGLITIDGIMQVKKQTSDAFQNFDDGIIKIKSNGELKIKP